MKRKAETIEEAKKLMKVDECNLLTKLPQELFGEILEYAPASKLSQISTSFNINPTVEEFRRKEFERRRIDDYIKTDDYQDVMYEMSVGSGTLAFEIIFSDLNNIINFESLDFFNEFIAAFKKFTRKYIKSKRKYVKLLFKVINIFMKEEDDRWIDNAIELLDLLFDVNVTKEELKDREIKSINEILLKCGISNEAIESLEYESKINYNQPFIKINDIILDPFEMGVLATMLSDDNYFYHTAFNNLKAYYEVIFDYLNKVYFIDLIIKVTPPIFENLNFFEYILNELPCNKIEYDEEYIKNIREDWDILKPSDELEIEAAQLKYYVIAARLFSNIDWRDLKPRIDATYNNILKVNQSKYIIYIIDQLRSKYLKCEIKEAEEEDEEE